MVATPEPMDALLAALIGKLPPSGASWPAAKRAAWLELVWKAFDVVYDDTEGATEIPAFIRTVGQAAAAPAPAKPVAIAADAGDEDPRFYIAKDGRALRDPGAQAIGINDIPREETLWDERPAGAQDLDTIVWKGGQTWPAAALPSLNIASAA